MNKFEKEEIEQIKKNIDSNISKNNSKKEKKQVNVSEKNCCIAAVKYNTIGDAYKDIEDNIEVYLIKEDKNNSIKTIAYTRCSKNTSSQNQLCHLHSKMLDNKSSTLKIFNNDILPRSNDDKNRYLANINDDFFEKMGKRGAKKKNITSTFTFTQDDNPILLVLNHKNPKLTTQLSVYARNLLNDQSEYIDNNDSAIPIKNSIKENKTMSLENLLNIESQKINIQKNESDDNIQKNESDDNIENESDDNIENESNNNIENDIEEVSYTVIDTINNEKYCLNDSNDEVYKFLNEEDVGQFVGILKEIPKKYHQIKIIDENNGNKEKYYTIIMKEEIISKKGKVFFCYLTKKLFNDKFKHIGSYEKIENDKYEYKFLDKK